MVASIARSMAETTWEESSEQADSGRRSLRGPTFNDRVVSLCSYKQGW
jgi:hypothetical protein